MDISGINNNINRVILENSKKNASQESFEVTLKNALDKKDDKQLQQVCQDFEGILLNMMYKEMKSTIHKSELMPHDAGREVFESMLDDKLVEEASKGKGLGLADLLYKQVSKQLKTRYTVE